MTSKQPMQLNQNTDLKLSGYSHYNDWSKTIARKTIRKGPSCPPFPWFPLTYSISQSNLRFSADGKATCQKAIYANFPVANCLSVVFCPEGSFCYSSAKEQISVVRGSAEKLQH